VCDGGCVTGVVSLLLSREHIVEFEMTGAGSQHQETLTGREGTTGETALVSVAFVEDRHWAKPQDEEKKIKASGDGHKDQERKNKVCFSTTPFLKV